MLKENIVRNSELGVLALPCLNTLGAVSLTGFHTVKVPTGLCTGLFILGVKLPFVPHAAQMFNTFDEKQRKRNKRNVSFLFSWLRGGKSCGLRAGSYSKRCSWVVPTTVVPGHHSAADRRHVLVSLWPVWRWIFRSERKMFVFVFHLSFLIFIRRCYWNVSGFLFHYVEGLISLSSIV